MKLSSADTFRAAAKSGDSPELGVFQVCFEEPKAVDASDRTLRFVFSDGSVDRAGDTVNPKGWDLAAFNKNPIALWSHDAFTPIGRASNVGPSGAKLLGDIEFMPPETSEFADSIYRMVKGGYLRGVSVGFMPTKWTFVDSKDRPFGIDFVEQSLLEISLCALPCNENALLQARSAGIDTKFLMDWAEKILDGGANVMIPRSLLEETFRQAKTPRPVRQKYLSKAAASEWKVDALSDLPIEDAAWDAPAAAKRMLDDAGFDSDAPDADKASRGFLVHDAANPTLRSSYTLPFADIIGGELKAVKAGIIAATSSLPGAPAEASAGAKAIIEAYTKQFGDVPAPEKIIDTATTEKSGRRISSANKALLQTAMDHHASATECINAVLASNAAADAEDESGDNQPEPVQLSEEDPVTKRKREAQALIATAKTKH